MGGETQTPDVGARHGPARDRGYDPGFSLAAHVAKIGAVALALAGLGIWLALGVDKVAWAFLPAIWLVANFVEWTVHRFPMHRPMWPRVLYENHSLIHHHAFDDIHMEIDDPRDLCLVMMPWYTLVLVFVGASPLFVITGLLAGPAAAGVFLVGGVAYFLAYELTHTLQHLRWTSLRRVGLASRFLAWLRAHHHHHHRLERMAHVNFNVTIPLADRVLRTYERPTRRLDPM